MANEDNSSSTAYTPVLIIGAGISGICAGIELQRRLGLKDFIIVEKSVGIGGTWYDQRYPGLGL